MSNPSINSLTRIRSRLPNLAVAERQVADWVLQHSNDVVQSSMAQVALERGVSDTTVLRFCRAAGFKGYMDLKLSIARDMASPNQLIHDDIVEGDAPAAIARKVFMSHVQALYDTLEILDKDDLEKAASMIIGAGKIFIVGVGTSNPIANEAYNKFFRLGFNCHLQTDSYLQLMEAALVAKESELNNLSKRDGTIIPLG